MNRPMRFMFVCAVAAGLMAPGIAKAQDAPVSRSCWRQIGMVCGSSWATYATCLQYRTDRLSERCQTEVVRQVLASQAAQRRKGEPEARPAP
jgi:hypothetical protein